MDGPLPIDSIRYSLHRSRRRTISVEVRVSGAIIVRTPMRMSIASIETFLLERISWIMSRMERAAEARTALPLPRVGEYYLRGELQKADLLIPGETHLRCSRQLLRKCYRNMAKTYFPIVIADVLPSMGVHGLRYAGLKLRSMHRRWGSCTGGGVITLNDRLAMTPDHCIRAVIVHELCHLVHMDHGKAFRAMTRDIMPDIDEADTALDQWSAVMALEVGGPKENGSNHSQLMQTKNGALGPVEDRMLSLTSRVFANVNNAGTGYADALTQSWSNDVVSATAIISGVRPSI